MQEISTPGFDIELGGKSNLRLKGRDVFKKPLYYLIYLGNGFPNIRDRSVEGLIDNNGSLVSCMMNSISFLRGLELLTT